MAATLHRSHLRRRLRTLDAPLRAAAAFQNANRGCGVANNAYGSRQAPHSHPLLRSPTSHGCYRKPKVCRCVCTPVAAKAQSGCWASLAASAPQALWRCCVTRCGRSCGPRPTRRTAQQAAPSSGRWPPAAASCWGSSTSATAGGPSAPRPPSTRRRCAHPTGERQAGTLHAFSRCMHGAVLNGPAVVRSLCPCCLATAPLAYESRRTQRLVPGGGALPVVAPGPCSPHEHVLCARSSVLAGTAAVPTACSILRERASWIPGTRRPLHARQLVVTYLCSLPKPCLCAPPSPTP